MEPTELFKQIFLGSGGGTPVAECGCGRVVFSDSVHYYDGELERLLAKEKAQPERYIHQAYDSVSVYELFGRTVVLGCPCDFPALLEQRLWANREPVAKYLRARAEREAKERAEVVALLESPATAGATGAGQKGADRVG